MDKRTRLVGVLAVAASLHFGCGDDDSGTKSDGGINPDGGPSSDGGSNPDGNPDGPPETCPSEDTYPATEDFGTTLGEVWVIETLPNVGAAFNPTTDPTPLWQTEVMTDGPCRLLRFEPAFCEDCFPPNVCLATDECTPYPDQVSAGEVTITGLHEPITLEEYKGQYYFAPKGPTPDDLFDPGASVTAAATGATFDSFTVSAVGVSRFTPDLPVETDGDSTYYELPLENGADYTFTWDDACPGTRMRLTLRSMTQGGHGTPLGTIVECDVEDTGSVTLPQSMVESLPELPGYQIVVAVDYPASSLVRYHRGTVAVTGGEVELLVGYEVRFYVEHALP